MAEKGQFVRATSHVGRKIEGLYMGTSKDTHLPVVYSSATSLAHTCKNDLQVVPPSELSEAQTAWVDQVLSLPDIREDMETLYL